MKRFNIIAFFFALLLILTPNQALADIGGLKRCADSPAFTKRLNGSVIKLELRINQYEKNSPPALALQQQIDRTKARFDKYSR
jgi:photosystem I subunit 3